MKNIKDLVIQHKGIWPEEVKDCDSFVLVLRHPSGEREEINVVKSEFEAEAKRLGYINGYLWGEAYPTNGKRPDLPDDVLVDVKAGLSNAWLNWTDMDVSSAAWTSTDSVYPATHFKVIDPRHKPVDEVSEIAESINKAEYVSEISKSNDFEMNENSWHERGELPPAGVECEVYSTYNGWVNCKILAHGICRENGKVAFWQAEHDCGVFYSDNRFRPIRTHREKVVGAAKELLKTRESGDDVFEKLYDAGMLVLPGTSCNTKG